MQNTGIPFANFYSDYEKELLKLTEVLEGKVQLPDQSEFHSSMTTYPVFTGMHSGRKVQLSVNIELAVPFLEIALVSQFEFQMLLCKETLASKLGKGLGIEHEIALQQGEKVQAFDKEFLIRGKPDDRIRHYLLQEGVVDTITKLGNFEKLETGENHISAWYVVNAKKDLETGLFLERLDLLHKLADYAE